MELVSQLGIIESEDGLPVPLAPRFDPGWSCVCGLRIGVEGLTASRISGVWDSRVEGWLGEGGWGLKFLGRVVTILVGGRFLVGW